MGRPKDLKTALNDELSEEELEEVPTSFDVVGDIAIIKIPELLIGKEELIGEALMKVQGNVNTVLRQTSPVDGEFRTRDLEVIAGEEKTITTHTEYGCSFKVDLAKMYFSPRLGHERNRIAQLVNPDEIVTNMFAGVGCYSILIAKKSDPEKVYSIDKNEHAVEYMRENIRINKVGEKVIPVQGDAREAIEEHLQNKADRVLMPLPEFGRDFIDSAIQGLKKKGGILHFYDYGEEPDLFEPSLNFVKEEVTGRSVELKDKNVVRSYAPELYHIVLDLVIGEE